MTDSVSSLIDRLRDFDERRKSMPGEHWLTFAAGVNLLLLSPRPLPARLACRAAEILFVIVR